MNRAAPQSTNNRKQAKFFAAGLVFILLIVISIIAYIYLPQLIEQPPPSVEKSSPNEIGITRAQWLYAIRHSCQVELYDLKAPRNYEKPIVFKGDKNSTIKILGEQYATGTTMHRVYIVVGAEEFDSNEATKRKFSKIVKATADLIFPKHKLNFDELFALAQRKPYVLVQLGEFIEGTIIYKMPGQQLFDPDNKVPDKMAVIINADQKAIREAGLLGGNNSKVSD